MKKHTLKKALALFLMLAMVVPCLPVIAWAGEIDYTATYTPTSGWYTSKDEDKKLYISSAEDLVAFANANNTFAGWTIYLTSDITWNDATIENGVFKPSTKQGDKVYAWTPIDPEYTGTEEDDVFKGIFDGQGHTIYGLYVNSSETSTGAFFKAIQGATIQNVNFENCYFSTTNTDAAGLGFIVGTASGSNTFSNVHVNGYQNHATNIAFAKVGGICGVLDTANSTSTFTDCTVNGTVAVGADATIVGGLLGYTSSNTITVKMTNCVNYASVNGKNYVAGLVGRFMGAATFENCTSIGKITATGTAALSASLATMVSASSASTAKDVIFTNCYYHPNSYSYAATMYNGQTKFNVAIDKTIEDGTDYSETTLTSSKAIAEDLTAQFKTFSTGSSSAVVVDGVQQSLDKTAARFVSKVVFNINQTQDNIAAVGFEVSCLGQEATAMDCGHVYKTIYSTYNGVTTPIVAGEGEFEGVDYLATVVIPDIPANETKTLLVRGYLKNPKADGTFATVYSNQSSLLVTFANGNIVGIAYV